MKNLIKTEKKIYLPNIEFKQEYDFSMIRLGYIFTKTPVNKIGVWDEYIIPVKGIRTLFNKNDNFIDKIIKTFIEYTNYGKTNDVDTAEVIARYIKVIEVLDEKGIEDYANKIASENRAYSSELLEDICKYVTIEIDKIKNKELKILVLDILNESGRTEKVHPKTLLQYIYYKLTGNTLFINNEKIIKESCYHASQDTIENVRSLLVNYSEDLAKVFNTYKRIFVEMKSLGFKSEINKISKISKRVKKINLKPIYTIDTLEWMNHSELCEFCRVTPLPKLIKLYHVIQNNIFYSENDKKVFVIRNGKTFLKEGYDFDMNEGIIDTIKSYISLKLKEIKEVIYLPEEWKKIAFETSNKKVLDGIPKGSIFELLPGDRIGIYWDYVVDYDLSLAEERGTTFAWNSSFGNKETVFEFSGDKTSASKDKPSTELFTIHNIPENSYSLRCNYYSGGSFVNQKSDVFKMVIIRDNTIIEELNLDLENKSGVLLGNIYPDTTRTKILFRVDGVSRLNGATSYCKDNAFFLNKVKPLYINDLLESAGVRYEKISHNTNKDKITDIVELFEKY